MDFGKDLQLAYKDGYQEGMKDMALEMFKELQKSPKGYISLDYLKKLAKKIGVEVE
jgi:hypothetical protein